MFESSMDISDIPIIEKLPWDSEFFGFNVGRLMLESTTETLDHDTKMLIEKSDYRLIYIFSNIEQNISLLNSKMEINLYDTKQTYSRNISGMEEFDTISKDYPKKEASEELIRLAVVSGKFSRFNKDPKIPKSKFEDLYKLWIQRSTRREIASDVLIRELHGELAGFVTLGKKNGRGDIGIIAVDEKFRNLGIGADLVYSACQRSLSLGFKECQVVTQKDNLAAIHLYKKCGFTLEHEEFVYHAWKR